jgi:hypothetical protein
MIRGGRRRGGLGRTLAKTALIAGTAQAVSGSVARRQRADADRAARHRQAERQGERDRKAALGLLTDEVVDQLKKLAELRDAGVLTQKEFAAKKAKLLP